ncbi:MAG: hypothetical protein LBP37_02095 [Spirochaetaceae bacterium]|jgi:hypothetical protein|nr:hypothetical protein [Spirochaetaceae bacterium]
MTERDIFTMAEEFADVDFNEERLEKRFRKTMETLAKDLRKSIYGNSKNRAEAKAIYKLLGNDKFNKNEILLMYLVIAVFIMNLTYIARIHPEMPCTIVF